MARRKKARRREGPKRTISPEQQAMMQAARKRNRELRARQMADAPHESVGYTDEQLAQATRSYRKFKGRRS